MQPSGNDDRPPNILQTVERGKNMDSMLGLIFVLAMIAGFVKGLTDDHPSFWRGFGEGLAGRGKFRGGTYVFFHDRRTGLGMGTRIDPD